MLTARGLGRTLVRSGNWSCWWQLAEGVERVEKKAMGRVKEEAEG